MNPSNESVVYSRWFRVQTLRLAIRMIHVDVTWTEQLGDDCGLVGSISLVGSVDGTVTPACPPVCPVHVILKQSQSPDVVLTHNYGHKHIQYYTINQHKNNITHKEKQMLYIFFFFCVRVRLCVPTQQ